MQHDFAPDSGFGKMTKRYQADISETGALAQDYVLVISSSSDASTDFSDLYRSLCVQTFQAWKWLICFDKSEEQVLNVAFVETLAGDERVRMVSRAELTFGHDIWVRPEYLVLADAATTFDPTSSTTISLTDTENFEVNDPIYISNSVVSGDDGFYGIITAVNHAAKTLTIDGASYVMSPGATFAMGSVLEEVPIVTYQSPVDGSGITRDSGFGAVLMGANTTMTLEYLNAAEGVVALPLTEESIVNDLRTLKVTITKTSASRLSNGKPYSVSVSQSFGIRNLNYLY